MLGMIADRMDDRFNAGPLLIATGEQTGPRGRTDGARRMKVGQLQTFRRQPIDLGSFKVGIAETADYR